MKRLAPNLVKSLKNDFDIITLSDVNSQPEWSCFHYVTGEFRSKHSHFDIFRNKGPLIILRTLLKIRKHHSVHTVISTGPGICVLSGIFFKILGAKVIHIETWSRFHTVSITGRIMHFFSDVFYVQNYSQLQFYRKAIYSGKL